MPGGGDHYARAYRTVGFREAGRSGTGGAAITENKNAQARGQPPQTEPRSSGGLGNDSNRESASNRSDGDGGYEDDDRGDDGDGGYEDDDRGDDGDGVRGDDGRDDDGRDDDGRDDDGHHRRQQQAPRTTATGTADHKGGAPRATRAAPRATKAGSAGPRRRGLRATMAKSAGPRGRLRRRPDRPTGSPLVPALSASTEWALVKAGHGRGRANVADHEWG
ncbi:hypothetical protein GCM10010435_31580 [Winogradskya consettensis]|uniref:Uncharacterized protein n=1 Tax=Winogradskya consettensis TaxID=113560 RepID=A0A919VNR7_9ACTN|nr:hypothetical protein Aco04nite_19920 [Actinoplanes consettensis]